VLSYRLQTADESSQLWPQGPETALYEENNAKGVSPDTVDKLRKMFAFLDAMQDAEELHHLPAHGSRTR
jgi:hypothetical protein